MAKLPANLKFEDAMRRLDEIVQAMESGQIGIEDSISKYEEAMTLRAHCQKILDDAELRIKKIQIDAAGNMQTEPLAAGKPESEDDEP